jgi:DNA-binding SARP family transcriptional activator/tetratricopeptide (TPR) repeat protein
MEFRLLGPLEVLDEGRPLELGGAKQRALIALLLLNANRIVSRDRLIDALWEEEPTATAQKALQVYVSQLRKLVGKDRLQTRPPGYLLRVEPEEIDLGRFQLLQKEGRLQEALSLWRGPPLSEFAYRRFAQAEIARLEELGLAVLEERIDRDLAEGRHAALVGELEALVQEHPLRERMRGQLMLALYRSGRQADALASYQEARRALVEELGIEPGKPLRELHQAILRQDPSLEVAVEAAEQRPATAFVGRDAELDELLEGLDDAAAGHGRLFLLVGEPGIGKSRLAEELSRRARGRGFGVLVGRCWEAGGAPAYWPWVQSLRGHIRESEPQTIRAQLGAGAAELAQILPELRELLPDLPQAASLESESDRFRLFDATATFLRNVSASRPLLLFLDDLHAADAPSLLLLRFLARELASSRLLVLGALRDVDPVPGQPLRELLAEVTREPTTRRVSLGGLSEEDVGEYVSLTASELALPELVAALHEETEGNPLFVGETLRLLALEGLRLDSGAAGIAIPQSVRDVIARRLAHLSDKCNRVLALGSVLGREFSLGALARASGLSGDALLDTLDEAMAARVVTDVPGASGRLRFAHVLIRDTLYEGLTTARRVRLHRLAVGTLEALYGKESGPHLAELVHHSIAGSDFEKGLLYAERAGDRALASLAYEEAARLYGTALEALDLAGPPDESRRCRLLLSLGEAEVRAGNTPAAKNAFVEAAGIARRFGLPRELAYAAVGYGGRIVWARAGDDDRLVPLLEEGLAALEADDLELQARLLARLAGALRDEHSRERRDALSGEAVELARRTGNPGTLAYSLDARASAIVAPDTVAECLALADELFEVASRIGDNERVVAAHHHRIIAQLLVGDPRAEVDHAAASRIAHELRQPAQLWQACANEAMLALAAGRLVEAEERMAEALALGERAQPGAAIPIYRLHQYTLGDFQGRLEEVEPAIRDLVTEYPARLIFRCVLAHVHARLGRLAEARQAFDDLAHADFSPLPFDQEWLFGMSLLAETCALLGDSTSAPVVYRLLLPWAALNAVDVGEGIRGSVARYLGLLAAMTERWSEAARHFEDALEMNERTGALPWLAHTQNDYAQMLLARNDTGDRERAAELVQAAVATYRELGMESYAEKASTLAVV